MKKLWKQVLGSFNVGDPIFIHTISQVTDNKKYVLLTYVISNCLFRNPVYNKKTAQQLKQSPKNREVFFMYWQY